MSRENETADAHVTWRKSRKALPEFLEGLAFKRLCCSDGVRVIYSVSKQAAFFISYDIFLRLYTANDFKFHIVTYHDLKINTA